MKRSSFPGRTSPAPIAAPGIEATEATEATVKDRILSAAHRCFEHFGVAKTTMEDVAQVVGLARQTLYKYFPSKGDLITALCVNESLKLNAEIHRRVRRRRGIAARITESVMAAVHVARENPYIRFLIEPQEIRNRLTDRNDPVFKLQRERWAPLLQAGQASGELAKDLDPDETVTWLSLAQMALLVQFEQPGRDAELEHMVQRFVVAPLLAQD